MYDKANLFGGILNILPKNPSEKFTIFKNMKFALILSGFKDYKDRTTEKV